MKIVSLSVQSLSGLSIQSVSFQAPTLLVGLSGSGKSQILMCIHQLYNLLLGKKEIELDDGFYQLEFLIHNLLYEFQVHVEGFQIMGANLYSNGQKIPLEHLNFLTIRMITPVETIRKSDKLIETISQASIEVQDQIKSLYQFMFSTIEAIDMGVDHLRFKERNMNWIAFESLSDGMLKTFVYVCELVLSEPGSVLLIDEFENGLGLNCMNILLDEMLSRDDLQFILSSHHPYVINNIPASNWQVISRQQNVISARSSEAFGIGQTRYDAFFELMNGLYGEEDF